jgi:hypothetical protein
VNILNCSDNTAQTLARDEVQAVAREFAALAQRAAEIANGGEAYPAAVRDLAGRLAADVTEKAQTLVVIMDRAMQIRDARR